jgi:uncharacterized alkaline shock family protein YloU
VVPAEERGRTEIADRVPERIAARVNREADQAGGVTRRLLGVALGHSGTAAPPRVSAQVDGGLVTMRMTVSVAYPAPVRQVVRRLRERVIGRVGELTGLRVGLVEVDVCTRVTARRGRVS